MMSERASQPLVGVEGEVKWFDSRKGFGFLVGPEGQDIFVHYSVIDGSGYRSLRDGTTVEYDAEQTDKGWKASRVVCHTSVETPSEPSASPSPDA